MGPDTLVNVTATNGKPVVVPGATKLKLVVRGWPFVSSGVHGSVKVDWVAVWLPAALAEVELTPSSCFSSDGPTYKIKLMVSPVTTPEIWFGVNVRLPPWPTVTSNVAASAAPTGRIAAAAVEKRIVR